MQTRANEEPRVPLTDAQLDSWKAKLSASYFGRPADERLRRHFDAFLEERARFVQAGPSEDVKREAQLIVATGETGAGKSRALRRLLLGTPRLAPSEDGRVRPCVRLSVRAPATLKSVGLELSKVLGYPLSPETRENVVWAKVIEHLASAGTEVLVLEEFQNASSRANKDEAVRLRDTIKSLLIDEHPVILVLSGLPEIVDFVRFDGQVRRRARFTAFETLDVEDAPFVTEAIASLARDADLALDDKAFRTNVVPRLVHAACGQLGNAVEMAIEAVLCALRPRVPVHDAEGEEVDEADGAPRESLTVGDFASMFEERTDNMPFANPFLAKDWHLIDPTQVGVHLPSQMRRMDGEAGPRSLAKSEARKGKGK